MDDGEFKVELSSSPTLTQSIQTFINEQKSSEPHDDTPQEDPRITQARRDVAREIVDEAMHAGVQMFLDGDQVRWCWGTVVWKVMPCQGTVVWEIMLGNCSLRGGHA